jgi:hypothetical protein
MWPGIPCGVAMKKEVMANGIRVPKLVLIAVRLGICQEPKFGIWSDSITDAIA